MTEKFTPSKGDYIRVQGNKQYLPVPQRVQWFRGEHPMWTIDTSIIKLDWAEGYVVMRAEVRDESGRVIASGTKTETRKGFSDFVEKAETGAVGRALARVGYGTEDALDLEGERYADAPIQQSQGGERTAQSEASAPKSATTRPAAQRSPEENRLRDELVALAGPRGGYAYLQRLSDEVGVEKGKHATASQLSAMIDLVVSREGNEAPAAHAGMEEPGLAAPVSEPAAGDSPPPAAGPPPRTVDEAIAAAEKKAKA